MDMNDALRAIHVRHSSKSRQFRNKFRILRHKLSQSIALFVFSCACENDVWHESGTSTSSSSRPVVPGGSKKESGTPATSVEPHCLKDETGIVADPVSIPKTVLMLDAWFQAIMGIEAASGFVRYPKRFVSGSVKVRGGRHRDLLPLPMFSASCCV